MAVSLWGNLFTSFFLFLEYHISFSTLWDISGRVWILLMFSKIYCSPYVFWRIQKRDSRSLSSVCLGASLNLGEQRHWATSQYQDMAGHLWIDNPVVLNRSVVTPLRDWMTLSQGSLVRYPAYQIFTVHNRAKLQLWNSNKNDFMVGGQQNMMNCIKGTVSKGCSVRKLENNCDRQFILFFFGRNSIFLSGAVWQDYCPISLRFLELE